MLVINKDTIHNLDEPTKVALAKLLNSGTRSSVWDIGFHGELSLECKIIKHIDADTKKVRYELLSNESFRVQKFSTYYKSLATLSLTDFHPHLAVKQRKQGKMRLIKEQLVDAHLESEEHLGVIQQEAEGMLRNSFFHSKPLIHSGNRTYIVMRELPGEELFDIISQNKLTIQERWKLSVALLRALKTQIHDLDLIHRDIKPENILVERNGVDFIIYIIDFGYITPKDKDIRFEHRGSPAYAAPEVFGFTNKTEKVDIYSMGRVLMYLWGDEDDSQRRYLLDQNNPKTWLKLALNPGFEHIFSRMTYVPKCHDQIRNLIISMCRVRPEERPELPSLIQSFEQLCDELQEVEDVKPGLSSTYGAPGYFSQPPTQQTDDENQESPEKSIFCLIS